MNNTWNARNTRRICCWAGLGTAGMFLSLMVIGCDTDRDHRVHDDYTNNNYHYYSDRDDAYRRDRDWYRHHDIDDSYRRRDRDND